MAQAASSIVSAQLRPGAGKRKVFNRKHVDLNHSPLAYRRRPNSGAATGELCGPAILIYLRALRQLTLAWSLLLFAAICHADLQYELTWRDIAGPGLWVDTATVIVNTTQAGAGARITLNEIRSGEGSEAIRLLDVSGECGEFSLTASELNCGQALFEVGSAQTESQDWGAFMLTGALRYALSGTAEVVGAISRGEAELDFNLTSQPDGAWQMDFTAAGQAVSEIWPLAGVETEIVLQDGVIDFTGVARPSGAGRPLLDITFTLAELGFENPTGTVAGAGLSAIGTLQYELGEDHQRFDLAFQPQGGEALLDFAYLLFGENAQPVVRLAGQYEPGRLDLDELSVRTPGVLSANGAGTILFGEDIYFERLRFELEEMAFPQAKDRYLDSVLARFGFTEAQFEGSLNGVLEWRAGVLSSVVMQTDALTMDDPRLGFVGLDAQVFWSLEEQETAELRRSQIAWQDARLYDLEVGPGELHLDLNGLAAKLAEPTRIPVFDGALKVDAFELSRQGTDGSVDLVLLAAIEPISLAPLSTALGWPPLEGSLAGEIPRIEWVDGVLELGGAMSFDVFDGRVIVDNVSLERPLGVLATFAADLALQNLDLRQVTSAFEFGEIRGRLSGNVLGLRLLDWQPVAFDAVLQTPSNDRSKHRISQRAVDNLSSLGGGAGAAIQQTFLRFFEDFSYDRLGLRCVLRNNICTMSGVENRGNGFYIVKGRGIPRIDVIGFQRQVDWPQLLARLKAATDSGDVTIE